MIALLSGRIVSTGKDSVIVDVGGVGFRVFVPQSLLAARAEVGDELVLHTHLHVRENELSLYGLETEDDLKLFRLLQTVSGIGPRAALSILSALPSDQLRHAIAHGDEAALAHVKGIGPKTAKKLVLDLKDKVEAVEGGLPPSFPSISEADVDLIAALTGLGYSVAEAQEAIRHLPRGPLSFEEKVRLALAYFVS
ncbi:MAG TPA: Holliday junction branch migration protein RuvA [Anaerolineae bacterium]|nr:Holliday junction branch migration protein RuvA [Anaerolineae bacterium]